MKSIALILSLACTDYSPEHLEGLVDYMNSKPLSPAVEVSIRVLDEDIRHVCKRQPSQTLEWVTNILKSVNREYWEKNGVGVIYTPTGEDYRPTLG